MTNQSMPSLETITEQRSFGGVQGFYKHVSAVNNGTMKFAVYKPPQAEKHPVPVLYYLAGLTCTEETFVIKGGAQRMASQLGLMLVAPDTSPRNTGIEGEASDWEFGAGAGFYVDATQAPWSKFFNMYSYVTKELPQIVGANFPADMKRESIFGHSMGGHGALTIALKNASRYKSVSAFAPIVAPSQVHWGQKALPRYLGEDQKTWADYDATQLLSRGTFPGELLIDQGDADKFLKDELRPEIFEAAAAKAGQKLTLRIQPGYDHSYYFISTFMDDHLKHHATA
jgi:S-formylglutathione hydrolase